MKAAAVNARLFDRLHGYASLTDDREAAEAALTSVYSWWAGTAPKPAATVCDRAHELIVVGLIDNARAGLSVVTDGPDQDSADIWPDDERETADRLLVALCGAPTHGPVRAPEYTRPPHVEAAVRVAREMAINATGGRRP